MPSDSPNIKNPKTEAMKSANSPPCSPLKRKLEAVLLSSSDIDYIAQEEEANRNLSDAWRLRAKEELNEHDDVKNKKIDELRSYIIADENLRVRTDDAFLLRFLRARKFDSEKAFNMLQRYYLMKLRSPELFKAPKPSEASRILDLQAQNMLEDRDQFGCRVYIFRVQKCDASQVSVEDVFRTNVLAMEHIVREPETQISGVTVLVDMTGLSLQHGKYLSPYYVRTTVQVIQETMPLRFRGFHVINEPFYFDAIMNVMKPFLKEKIRRRIYLHGSDYSSLHAFISPAILPKEYGGHTVQAFSNHAYHCKLLADEKYFIELEEYGYVVENDIKTPSDLQSLASDIGDID